MLTPPPGNPIITAYAIGAAGVPQEPENPQGREIHPANNAGLHENILPARSDMTTKPTATHTSIRLPDPPEPEDMNNYAYFNSLGNGLHLSRHFGNEDTTYIHGDVYLSRRLTDSRHDMLQPDLLIAFNVDPAACRAQGGYVIEEQGKPPDFVLEIGSSSTGQRDVTTKRDGYAALGVSEYWRFDPSGGHYHGAHLAGDRLVDGIYQPIPITQMDDENFSGHSGVLNLDLRWEQGQLGWYDPVEQRHIVTFDDERARADAEQAARIQAETRADTEQAARIQAEARVRELEKELRRLREP